MPVHDWTRVEAGIFHDFHNSWTTHLKESLNAGLLPPGFYALAEQHANEIVSDVLALHAPSEGSQPGNGTATLLEAPPKVGRRIVAELRQGKKYAQRRVAVRHISNHRVVALIEIVSPANKDRGASVRTFTQKVRDSLELNVNLLVIDLFPPGKHDPNGMHAAIWKPFGGDKESASPAKPICLMSYVAKVPPEAYVEWIGMGAKCRLPAMPLFLDAKRYIHVPLDLSYEMAYRGVPEYWRRVIEKGTPTPRK